MTKPDWITLSKSQGVGNDTIEVSAPEYIAVGDRQGELTVKTASGTTKKVQIIQKAPVEAGLSTYWYSVNGATYIRCDVPEFGKPAREVTYTGTYNKAPLSVIIRPDEWINYTSGYYRVEKAVPSIQLEGTFGMPEMDGFVQDGIVYRPISLKAPVDIIFQNITYDVSSGWSGTVQLKLRFVDDNKFVTLGNDSDIAVFECTASVAGETFTGTTGINGLGTDFVYPFDFVPSTSPEESSSDVLITDVQLQSDAIYEFTLVNQ